MPYESVYRLGQPEFRAAADCAGGLADAGQVDGDDPHAGLRGVCGRRHRIITLTEEGNNLLAIVADAAAAEQDHFLHTLSDTERKRLNHLLQRLYDSHVPAADPQPG